MTEMRKSCSGLPSLSSGFCGPRMWCTVAFMTVQLPTVYRRHEAFGVGIRTWRKLDETVGTPEAEEISGSIGPPRIRPGTSPLVMLDGHRQEVRERMLECDRRRQGQALGRRTLGAHGFGDGRDDITDQTDQGGDGVAGQAEHSLSLGPDAEPHGPAGPLRDLVKDLLYPQLLQHLGDEIELTHGDTAAQHHDLVCSQM